MNYDTLFFLKDIVIAILIFTLVKTIAKIRTLKETLVQEKRKRSMPLVALEVNTTDDLGVYLINDSYCYAKNLTIKDLNVVIDYGFKKHLTLKFEPVDVLKPGKNIKLTYRVFDGEYDITETDSLNILNHFADSPLEIHLQYSNIEDSPFLARICLEKNQYVLKEVKPLNRVGD